MAANTSEDFRDWDLEVETDFSGTQPNGCPFFLWRESADNRLTLSRPRYCCITAAEGELYFAFFNPSEDLRSTGRTLVFGCVAGLVAAGILAQAWFETVPRLSYAHDLSAPPFLVLLAAVFWSLLVGSAVSFGWYVCITVGRWWKNRFEGDGRLYVMPWRTLDGFQVISASSAGTVQKSHRPLSGHGLAAVFNDGSQIVLTGNNWSYRSISEKHRQLTVAFRTPRDAAVNRWDQEAKVANRNEPDPQKAGALPETL